MEEDEQFPICLLTMKQEKEKTDDSDDTTSETETFLNGEVITNSNWVSTIIESVSFWKGMSLYDFGLLMSSILINNVTWAVESIFIFYYVLFMKYRYDKNIIYCTIMLFSIIFMYGMPNLIIPRLIKKVIPNYIWLMWLSSFIMIFPGIIGGILTYLEDVGVVWYWVISVPGGLLLGMASILSEMCILELQPKEHIGKITGWKDGIKMALRGASIGFVGIFWKSPYFESLWFGWAVCSVLCCVISSVVWIMLRIHKN